MINISNNFLTSNQHLKSSQSVLTVILTLLSVEICSCLLVLNVPPFSSVFLELLPRAKADWTSFEGFVQKLSQTRCFTKSRLTYERTVVQADWCGCWNYLLVDGTNLLCSSRVNKWNTCSIIFQSFCHIYNAKKWCLFDLTNMSNNYDLESTSTMEDESKK